VASPLIGVSTCDLCKLFRVIDLIMHMDLEYPSSSATAFALSLSLHLSSSPALLRLPIPQNRWDCVCQFSLEPRTVSLEPRTMSKVLSGMRARSASKLPVKGSMRSRALGLSVLYAYQNSVVADVVVMVTVVVNFMSETSQM
jgi:hypothetical protein